MMCPCRVPRQVLYVCKTTTFGCTQLNPETMVLVYRSAYMKLHPVAQKRKVPKNFTFIVNIFFINYDFIVFRISALTYSRHATCMTAKKPRFLSTVLIFPHTVALLWGPSQNLSSLLRIYVPTNGAHRETWFDSARKASMLTKRCDDFPLSFRPKVSLFYNSL